MINAAKANAYSLFCKMVESILKNYHVSWDFSVCASSGKGMGLYIFNAAASLWGEELTDMDISPFSASLAVIRAV